MKELIISTVGTSTLTNGASADIRKKLVDSANLAREAVAPDVVRHLEAHLHERGTEVAQMDASHAADASAELHGIVSYYEQEIHRGRGDLHVLIATDTWLGGEAARLVARWLENNGLSAQVVSPRDLCTASLDQFQVAMGDLARWCESFVKPYRDQSWRVVLNLTGGFKAVNGFLQALGMFYADEVVYVFERSEELLRLPRLPVTMAPIAAIREHVTAFRRMGELEQTLDRDALRGVPETLLFVHDDHASLSAWGEIHWAQSRPVLYRERLWPSPHPLVHYGDDFERSLRGLDPQRLTDVNERVDDLARYMLSGRQQPRARLDVKQLKGSQPGPSTHECDAWADQSARRIFLHFDKDQAVLDRLDKALH